MFKKRLDTHHEIQEEIFKTLPKEPLTKKEFLDFLNTSPKNSESGIYIHTPYCDKLCSFCNMNRKFCQSNMNDYTEFLIKEFDKYGKTNYIKNKLFSVVFWGGGTPTIYTEEQLEKLLKSFNDNFSLASDYEWTFESTLHNLDLKKLRILEKYGVNRLSLGVQTFSDKRRTLLNRTYSEEETIKRIKEIQNNFNGKVCIDIIYDYPYETEEEIIHDAQRCIELKIDSVSFCTLIIYEGAKIFNDIKNGRIIFNRDEDRNRKFHNLFVEELKKGNYKLIENGKAALNDEYRYINLVNSGKDLLPIGIGAGGNLNNIGIYKLNEFMEFYSLHTPFETKLKFLYGLFQYPTINLDFIKNIFPDKYSKIYNKLLDFSEKGYLTIENNIITLTTNGVYYGHSIDYEILKLCL